MTTTTEWKAFNTYASPQRTRLIEFLVRLGIRSAGNSPDLFRGYWRRMGSYMHVRATAVYPNTTGVRYDYIIPSGFQVDHSKIVTGQNINTYAYDNGDLALEAIVPIVGWS